MEKYLNIIKKAQKEIFAIPQFNINNLEWAKYVLEACNEEKSPVFLGVSLGAINYMGGYNTVVALIRGLINDLNIEVPVLIHLDHAPSFEACKEAYEAGFNSIMIDASLESIDDNIIETNKVTEMAKKAIIEAELGRIGGAEDDIPSELRYTSLDQAIYYCSKTKIDLLAASLGSVHGLYKFEPNINFDIMESIKRELKMPLVLHGGSGLSEDILKKCIQNGVIKINFNTELQVAWNNAVREFIHLNETIYDPRKIISSGEKAIKATVKNYIYILGSKNKG